METTVCGAALIGFSRACPDLGAVTGSGSLIMTKGIDVRGWYPLAVLQALEAQVLQHYESPSAVLERVGMEMMSSWYLNGPGQQIISGGIEFLQLQSRSRGYLSLVRGPEEQLGTFALLKIDLSARTATIHSTTPFNKDLERGVIIGGMSAPGDLDLVQVDNSRDPRSFHVAF